jgi:hypothetical protein
MPAYLEPPLTNTAYASLPIHTVRPEGAYCGEKDRHSRYSIGGEHVSLGNAVAD